MPFIRVRALPPKDQSCITRTLTAMSAKLCAEAGFPSDQVVVTWEGLNPNEYIHYAELKESQPVSTHPPIVEIVAISGKPDTTVAAIISAAAEVVSSGLNVDKKNVVVIYLETAAKHIFAEGRILGT